MLPRSLLPFTALAVVAAAAACSSSSKPPPPGDAGATTACTPPHFLQVPTIGGGGHYVSRIVDYNADALIDALDDTLLDEVNSIAYEAAGFVSFDVDDRVLVSMWATSAQAVANWGVDARPATRADAGPVTLLATSSGPFRGGLALHDHVA
jgi:hypothetical protein